MTDQFNSNNRQWVAVKFKPEDGRSYTYHNDADPVAIGDKVVVPNRGGTSPAEVVGLPLKPPPFATKAIIGKAPPPTRCDCYRCTKVRFDADPAVQADQILATSPMNKMFLCATCSNKRCPHAADHRNACTNSNEPGQKGSLYEDAPAPPSA